MDEDRLTVKRAATHVFFGVGGGIGNTVYGTVVVMAALTAAIATNNHPWKLAVVVSTTAFVLWFAHVYAHGLSDSIEQGRRLTGHQLLGVARRELGIALAAVPPTAALVLGAIGVLREASAIWLAFALGLLTLAAQGVRFARLERLGTLGTLAAIALNLALGLVVVALKVAVSH